MTHMQNTRAVRGPRGASTVGAGVRSLVAGTLALLITLTLSLVAGTAAHASSDPLVSVANSRVSPGGTFEVHGHNFTPETTVTAQVCGVPGPDGFYTCADGVELTVPLSGRFVHDVPAQEPPGQCPCSVVVQAAGETPAVSRVELIGHPMAAEVLTPQIEVDAVHVDGVTSLLSLFTGHANAEVALDVRNVGASAAQPTLQLEVGKSGQDGVAIPDPGVGTIDPGQKATLSVPVSFGSLLGGTFVVEGHLIVGDLHTPVSATTSVVPWGTILVLLGALGFAAVTVMRRRATRLSVRSNASTSRKPVGPAPLKARTPAPAAPVAAHARGAQVPGTGLGGTSTAVSRRGSVPAAGEGQRDRSGVRSVGELARAAADAAAAATAAALEKARIAEAREAVDEHAVRRDETIALATEQRLEALGRAPRAVVEAPEAARPAADRIPSLQRPAGGGVAAGLAAAALASKTLPTPVAGSSQSNDDDLDLAPKPRRRFRPGGRSRRGAGFTADAVEVGPARLESTPITRIGVPVAELTEPTRMPVTVQSPAAATAPAGGSIIERAALLAREQSADTVSIPVQRQGEPAEQLAASWTPGAVPPPLPVRVARPVVDPKAGTQFEGFLVAPRDQRKPQPVDALGLASGSLLAEEDDEWIPPTMAEVLRARSQGRSRLVTEAQRRSAAPAAADPAPVVAPVSVHVPVQVPTRSHGQRPSESSTGQHAAGQHAAVRPEQAVPVPNIEAAQARAAYERARASAFARDERAVANALETVRAHVAERPARLPDPHEYVFDPEAPRAERGGKRAARPENVDVRLIGGQ